MTDPRIDPERLAATSANPLASQVMRDEVVFCLPTTPIDAVAKLMADNSLTEVPVLVDRRPVGYVTAKSVVEQFIDGKVLITGSDFAMRPVTTQVTAQDVLQSPPLLVDISQPLSDVVGLMNERELGLALVMHEDQLPVGMITAKEIGRHLLVEHG